MNPLILLGKNGVHGLKTDGNWATKAPDFKKNPSAFEMIMYMGKNGSYLKITPARGVALEVVWEQWVKSQDRGDGANSVQ